jgi:hypothetical protein
MEKINISMMGTNQSDETCLPQWRLEMKTIEVTSSRVFADIDVGLETGGEGDIYTTSWDLPQCTIASRVSSRYPHNCLT